MYKNIIKCKNLSNLVNCLYSYEDLENKANGGFIDGDLSDISDFIDSCLYFDNRNTEDFIFSLKEDLNFYRFLLNNNKLSFFYGDKINDDFINNNLKHLSNFLLEKGYYSYNSINTKNNYLKKKIIGHLIKFIYQEITKLGFKKYNDLYNWYTLHIIQIVNNSSNNYVTLFNSNTANDIFNPFRQKKLQKEQEDISLTVDYISYFSISKKN